MNQSKKATAQGTKPSTASLLFRRHLEHLRSPLHPLLSIYTGQPHSDFPETLLHYHLLTEPQLDELAHFYHQRTPSEWSYSYPAPIVGRWYGGSIADKKRRFGHFIGLRGCESPSRPSETAEDEAIVHRWIQDRIRISMEKDRELDVWRSKGF